MKLKTILRQLIVVKCRGRWSTHRLHYTIHYSVRLRSDKATRSRLVFLLFLALVFLFFCYVVFACPFLFCILWKTMKKHNFRAQADASNRKWHFTSLAHEWSGQWALKKWTAKNKRSIFTPSWATKENSNLFSLILWNFLLLCFFLWTEIKQMSTSTIKICNVQFWWEIENRYHKGPHAVVHGKRLACSWSSLKPVSFQSSDRCVCQHD